MTRPGPETRPELEFFDADWLRLREPVDHATRDAGLEAAVAERLGSRPVRIVDLGAGSGSTLRHLAPRLHRLGVGPQRWTLLDHDEALLRRALTDPPAEAAEIGTGRVDLRDRDALTAALAGADLVTASALLDVLTEAGASGLVSVLSGLRPRPVLLLTLTVTGAARLDPAEPGDPTIAADFDADQRGHGLGPDAADRVRELLGASGWEVSSAATPWRLGPATRPLLEAWLTGWCAPGGHDAAARLSRGGDGLRARVPHVDLLAR
ncbi:SAM-dependent methyltransferase [Kineococcus gynurae]|uniref:SAM-dependent methyltransferase n=1 Tax=Kineococcus gynurae TaxID=452979 RepID=A0ABV5LUW6_9ACTN